MAEKVLVEDSLLNRLYIELYYRYKALRATRPKKSSASVSRWRTCSCPYRVEENVELLKRCGFSTVDTCFRWFNWAAFVAIRK